MLHLCQLTKYQAILSYPHSANSIEQHHKALLEKQESSCFVYLNSLSVDTAVLRVAGWHACREYTIFFSMVGQYPKPSSMRARGSLMPNCLSPPLMRTA